MIKTVCRNYNAYYIAYYIIVMKYHLDIASITRGQRSLTIMNFFQIIEEIYTYFQSAFVLCMI
jgi:hypothetical protein